MNELQLFSKENDDLKGIVFVFDSEIINEDHKKKLIDIINDLNGVSFIINLENFIQYIKWWVLCIKSHTI